MDIIIAGAGRVGRDLARVLSPHNNVVVIDSDAYRLEKAGEDLDILSVHGSAADPASYTKLPLREYDLFIAVTSTDEVNITASLIVSSCLKVHRKMARIHNQMLLEIGIDALASIDFIVSPEHEAATTVLELLENSWARDVITFSSQTVKAIALDITNQALHQQTIANLMQSFRGRIIACAIEREGTLLIPNGRTEILLKDRLYVLGADSDLKAFAESTELHFGHTIKRAVVLGANDIGIVIAKALSESGAQVKLLDRDLADCEHAALKLGDDVLVLNDRHTTTGIFYQESFHLADVLIAATLNDEYNVIMGMSALKAGVPRVISLSSNNEYYELAHAMGLDIAAGPKLATVTSLLQKLSEGKTMLAESYFLGKQGVVLRWSVPQKSSLAGQKISQIPFPEGSLAVACMRNEQAILLSGNFIVEPDDLLIIFCIESVLAQVKKKVLR
ncbi:NAD-binding protein [Chrysiogenes arsenatis]|uniref:NAD-binding protein n=1 Tax=Chrysiogenes arsenatis TaxID=309797 RepID=UPI000429767B|nr:NAD-binding protein [Chrysiogenes arsenatis]